MEGVLSGRRDSRSKGPGVGKKHLCSVKRDCVQSAWGREEVKRVDSEE